MNDREQQLIERAIQTAAENSPRHRHLPDARYFWLTSQLIPNAVEQERALKPMGVLQVMANVVVAICWAIVITWKWTDIRSWIGTPDLADRVFDAMIGAGSLPLSFLIIVGGLLCITTVVLLHSVFAEE